MFKKGDKVHYLNSDGSITNGVLDKIVKGITKEFDFALIDFIPKSENYFIVAMRSELKKGNNKKQNYENPTP